MKRYYLFLLTCILVFFSQSIQAQKFAYQKAGVYLLKNDFTEAKNLNNATYILQIIKYSDTNYTCRYYNKFGPMIKQEVFLDSNLSIPNGCFMWYDGSGNIDGIAHVYRGRKTDFTYYDDNIKPFVYIRYKDGKIFERRDYSLNIYTDSAGNTHNLAEMEERSEKFIRDSIKDKTPANADNNWNNYLSKHLVLTNRFQQSMPPGHYRITVSFLIDTDGKVDEVMLYHSVEWSEDMEVFSLFENGPQWQPAVQNGKNVIYRQKEDLDFTIGNN
jgi:protein TonB